MKKILSSLLFQLIIICFIKSQIITTPFEEVSFLNLNPEWIYTPIDSSLIGNGNFTGRNHFNNNYSINPYVIKDNFLYCANHTSYETIRVEGALIQKIDLNDGHLVWQNHYDLRNNDRQEWVKSMIIEDEKLILVTARRIVPPDNSIFYDLFGDTCLISLRKYDINTGDLLEQIINNSEDHTSIRINNKKTIINAIDQTTFQCYDYDNYFGIVNQFDIDEYGHLIQDPIVDTFHFLDDVNFLADGISHSKILYKISEDTLLSLDYLYSKIDSSIDSQTLITIYDKNLKISKQLRLDSQLTFNYRRLFIGFANSEFIWLYGDMPTDGFYDTIANMIINYDGIIERQFTCYYDSLNHSFSSILKLKNDDEFLLTSIGQRYYGLDFLKTQKSWYVDLYREYYVENKNYLFNPTEMILLDNNDVLINGYNLAYSDLYEKHVITWPTWMRINGEDLGLKTSTNDISQIPHLSISPNPTSTYFTINCEKEDSKKLEIIDQLGRVVMEENIFNCGENQVDISGFSSGMYFVRLLDEDNDVLGVGKVFKK